MTPARHDQLRTAVTDVVRWPEDAITPADPEFNLKQDARECRRDLGERLQGLHIETAAEANRVLDTRFADRLDLEPGRRVAAIADAIAERFPMSSADRTALHWAGRVHGLCRLAIPSAVLQKPGELSRKELAIVRRAPTEAFDVLLDHPFLAEPGYLLRSIRERQDGLGHPDGLVGSAIPLGSRILAVAEAIEAITHDQPHRLARSPVDAVLELLRCAGTQFDAEVVHAGVELMARR